MSRAATLLWFAAGLGCATPKLSAHASQIQWTGRVDRSDAAGPRLGWGGTQLELRFSGTQATLHFREGPAQKFERKERYPNRFRVELDGKRVAEPLAPPTIDVAAEWKWSTGELAECEHTLRVIKETEGGVGEAQLLGVELRGQLLPPASRPRRRIEFIGDSHTAGFGALGTAPCAFSSQTESHWNSFAAVAARALGAEAHFVAFSGRGLTRNHDDDRPPERIPELWRRTLPGRSSPDWDPRAFQPDAVVLLVGSNDFGRGDPGVGFADAYAAFLEDLRTAYPHAQILALSREQRGQLTAYVERALSLRRSAGDRRLLMAVLPKALPEDGVGCVGHATAATHARHAQVVIDALRSP